MHNIGFSCLHGKGLLFGLMVVAEKMQQSMDEKMGKMGLERLALVRCLGLYGLIGKAQVPKKANDRPSGGELGKREHIGRAVLAAPLAVKGALGRIVRKKNADLHRTGRFDSRACKSGTKDDRGPFSVLGGPAAGLDHNVRFKGGGQTSSGPSPAGSLPVAPS